ncbi:MAG: hypothetical protein Q7U16_14830 [Agitococcus sp.]|nr:hypothetical protein [Agitococcus sp.]
MSSLSNYSPSDLDGETLSHDELAHRIGMLQASSPLHAETCALAKARITWLALRVTELEQALAVSLGAISPPMEEPETDQEHSERVTRSRETANRLIRSHEEDRGASATIHEGPTLSVWQHWLVQNAQRRARDLSSESGN